MQEQPPSKTKRKRDMHALQALGEQLVVLSEEQLTRIELPDALREAVVDAKRIRSREARRRQLQFIGRLMREVDPAPIRAQLDAWANRSRAAVMAHHRVEEWRERLLAHDAGIAAFNKERPTIDLHILRACVHGARAEQQAGKPGRYFRQLFRLIRDALSNESSSHE
jgi:ribosome-associated protein